MAHGFSLQKGDDYDETFSKVVRFETVRTLLSLSAKFDMDVLVHHVDVAPAFSNGDLDEIIYMNQPIEFIDENKPNHVWKLQKSIYGLNQSSRCWNTSINISLKDLGFAQSQSE